MEQNVLEETVDPDILNALEWKDGFGTLPDSNLQFYVNESGQLEFLTEYEAKAVRALSTLASSSTNSAPAASNTPAAINTPAASIPALEVPKEDSSCSNFQTCEQKDGLENGNLYTQMSSQHHRESDTSDFPDDSKSRGNSSHLNDSSGSQVDEAERLDKCLRRKKRLPVDSEDDEEDTDEDEFCLSGLRELGIITEDEAEAARALLALASSSTNSAPAASNTPAAINTPAASIPALEGDITD